MVVCGGGEVSVRTKWKCDDEGAERASEGIGC